MKGKHCAGCPYEYEPLVEPVLIKNSDYMFIGTAPDGEDADCNELFSDGLRPGGYGRNAGSILHEYIDPLIEQYKVSLTSVLKCRHMGGGKAPTKKMYAACLPTLMKEIEHCNPKLIITLGKVAFTVVTGLDAPIKDYNGRIITDQKRPIAVSVSPSTALHKGGDIKAFERGMLPVLHFFDKPRPFKYTVKDPLPVMKGIVALDIETTGLRPGGVDWDDDTEAKREHAGKILCVGVSDGKNVHYSGVSHEGKKGKAD